MAVSTAFPPACYKIGSFLSKQGKYFFMDGDDSCKNLHGQAFLAWNWMFGTVAMPKKSAPVFPQGRIFSRLFPLILPHKLEQLSGFSF